MRVRSAFFLLSNKRNMKSIDKKLTQDIQNWLNTPSDKRDMQQGATMLLQLNRNRAFFNSVIMRPSRYAAKLEYELRKHLNIRLHNMTVSDVAAMEQAVLPRVERTLSAPSITPDTDFSEGKVAKGKRPDHDSLPAEIQQLWDSNAERYYKINELFNEIKAMADAEPCDRFEKLVILDKTEAAYRKALEAYDSYDTSTATPGAPVVADPKRISALRKSISTYKSSIAKTTDDTKKEALKIKLQSAVSELLSMKVGISETTRTELSALGISLD